MVAGRRRAPDTRMDGYFLSPRSWPGCRTRCGSRRKRSSGRCRASHLRQRGRGGAIANDSVYGLAAGVFTRELSTAHLLAARLQAGQIQVNPYPLGGVDTPFGGYKGSGLGREKGISRRCGLYTQLKTVIMAI